VVRPSVSVTLVHPAEAVGWNKMPFGSDTRVVLSDIVLDGGSGLPREGEIWGSELPVRSDAAYRQITSAMCYYVIVTKDSCDLQHTT